MTNLEIPKKNFNPKIKLLIALIIVIPLLLAASSYFVLSYSKSHSGLTVGDLDVSKRTYDEILNLLKANYADKSSNTKIVLKNGDIVQEVSFSEINVKYDIEKASRDVMSVGRSGNIFGRLLDIFNARNNGKAVEINYSYDEDVLKGILDNFYNKTIKYVKEADLYIDLSKVIIQTGHPGERIDINEINKIIEQSIKTCTGGEHKAPVITTPQSSIDVEDIYNKISSEVKDAKIELDSNNSISIIPHTMGRYIDKAELVNIINEIERTSNTEKVLPVKFIEPQVTSWSLKNNLFKDTLAAATTKFSTSTTNDANRGVNIRLATAKIDGKILLPGETFSFNEVVGPRTPERGYQVANVYVNGRIEKDTGGGICQVSTTLYNSVLFADLEAVQRRNHMFTVGYVPLGRDAAVSYGELDFQFKNTTKWPIKIEGSVSKNNRITFNILGTNENPDKSIQISHVQISSTPAPVKYIDDPTMDEGKTVVIQKGMTGYVIDTYKIVKIGNEVVSKTKIHRSVYKTLKREVKRGTKKVAVPTEVVDETLIVR